MKDLRAYDSQIYVDMLAGEEEDFTVPSDHLEQARELKLVREKIKLQQSWLLKLSIVFLVSSVVYFGSRVYGFICFLP